MSRKINKLRHQLSGARGLLVSVIAQAAIDATGEDDRHRRDALAYFASPLYQNHLTSLGLCDMLPDGLILSSPQDEGERGSPRPLSPTPKFVGKFPPDRATAAYEPSPLQPGSINKENTMLNFSGPHRAELSKLSQIKEPARAIDALGQAADILLTAAEAGEFDGETFEQVASDLDIITVRLRELEKELR